MDMLMDDYVGDAEKALETGQSSFHKVLFTWVEVRQEILTKDSWPEE
jgi:hypothetical protein